MELKYLNLYLYVKKFCSIRFAKVHFGGSIRF